MGEWKEYKIKEAPFEIIDGDRGKNYPSQDEFFHSGYCLFLSTKNVRQTCFDFSESQFITIEKDNLLRKGKLKRFDSILTTRGTVGNVAFYGNDIQYNNIRINSGMVIIRPNIEQIDPKYCFYIFRSLQANFETFTSGSAQPQLPIRDLNEMDILLPPLTEQEAIASILSSLDDKIDLLHRQNKTLEALAETLFRQWFVEEAEEGWETGTVKDFFILQRGFDLPAQHRKYGKYPIISASGVNGYHNEYKVQAPGITTGRSGLLGNVFYVMDDFWPLNTSLFIVEYKLAKPLFAYFFLKTIDLEGLNGGSAVPTLNRNDVHSLETSLPPFELINRFERLTQPMFCKIKENRNQIRTLTRLRDTLLPKLMSGEVRVGN